jgi:hypothetical protein
MAKKWMQGAVRPGHKGEFTRKAKAAGMGVQEYAGKVTAEGSGASTETKRQAAFAKAASSVAGSHKERRKRIYRHPSSQKAMGA